MLCVCIYAALLRFICDTNTQHWQTVGLSSLAKILVCEIEHVQGYAYSKATEIATGEGCGRDSRHHRLQDIRHERFQYIQEADHICPLADLLNGKVRLRGQL